MLTYMIIIKIDIFLWDGVHGAFVRKWMTSIIYLTLNNNIYARPVKIINTVTGARKKNSIKFFAFKNDDQSH